MSTYRLEGPLDLSNVMEILERLRAKLTRERALSLDLSRVTWIDSAGLAGLVRLLAEARRMGAELRLSAASEAVHRAFRFARLETLFPVEMTAEGNPA